MKKQILFILLVAAILPFVGCKEDMPTIFGEADGIYFSAPADSMTYTFAKYPHRVSDTLRIPVTVLGNAVGTDRPLSIEKLSGEGYQWRRRSTLQTFTTLYNASGKSYHYSACGNLQNR
jgi:hypothetical protein